MVKECDWESLDADVARQDGLTALDLRVMAVWMGNEPVSAKDHEIRAILLAMADLVEERAI